jgi:hypothetical protein
MDLQEIFIIESEGFKANRAKHSSNIFEFCQLNLIILQVQLEFSTYWIAWDQKF